MENHEKSCLNYLVSIDRGAAVPSIVKLICHIRAYMLLYANSCAAVNLCHRLLEERWDGGNIVGAGSWRRSFFDNKFGNKVIMY
jgi:hypothetical protein